MSAAQPTRRRALQLLGTTPLLPLTLGSTISPPKNHCMTLRDGDGYISCLICCSSRPVW